MPQTNQERVNTGMELLRQGLQPFIERELREAYGESWREKAKQSIGNPEARLTGESIDVMILLKLIDREWRDLFSTRLGKSHRAIVHELIAVRNSWAHQETFTNDDTDRALDSVTRLLRA